MGWFWASTDATAEALAGAGCPVEHRVGPASSGCPVDHTKMSLFGSGGGCPVDHTGKGQLGASSDGCPVDHSKWTGGSGATEALNPMNNMPELLLERAPGQKITLLRQRTISSIPKGESDRDGLWEYPSPQQMLNAMLRKGKAKDIPEDAVELMVDVHNFLNEGAWQQILEWEHKHTAALRTEPRLLKFVGKPHDLSPRARAYLALAKVFPLTFSGQPPFDRHDWTILRRQPAAAPAAADADTSAWQQVRYVIDYYEAPDDAETGMPLFMLDTRPALDSFGSCRDRFEHWAGPMWRKAMGEDP